MPDETAPDDPAGPADKTLADKVDWLFQTVHPPGRGPYSFAEVAARIEDITGEKISHTALWKLRTGRNANPTNASSKPSPACSACRPRSSSTTTNPRSSRTRWNSSLCSATAASDRAQLRAFAALTPDGRQAIADLIAATARADRNRQHAPATGSNP